MLSDSSPLLPQFPSNMDCSKCSVPWIWNNLKKRQLGGLFFYFWRNFQSFMFLRISAWIQSLALLYKPYMEPEKMEKPSLKFREFPTNESTQVLICIWLNDAWHTNKIGSELNYFQLFILLLWMAWTCRKSVQIALCASFSVSVRRGPRTCEYRNAKPDGTAFSGP